MSNSKEFNSFTARINNAQSQDELKRLETSLERLYNCGVFSAQEFAALDAKWCIKDYELS